MIPANRHHGDCPYSIQLCRAAIHAPLKNMVSPRMHPFYPARHLHNARNYSDIPVNPDNRNKFLNKMLKTIKFMLTDLAEGH